MGQILEAQLLEDENFGAADISAMLLCSERLTQTPAKVEGFSARNSLKSVFISTKWCIYFSLKQGLLDLDENLE